jgi:peroxiredoxin Q/BCP
MPLAVGDDAPPVSAANQDGETVEPSVEGPTVLYFYPKDDTPGCTIEAKQFNRELDTYHEAGVDVYGVSIDDVESHREFADEYDLEFDLLADPAREIADAYEVEDGPANTTKRTTFIIIDGQIHAVYEGVNPDGHAREVMLELVDEGIVDLDI